VNDLFLPQAYWLSDASGTFVDQAGIECQCLAAAPPVRPDENCHDGTYRNIKGGDRKHPNRQTTAGDIEDEVKDPNQYHKGPGDLHRRDWKPGSVYLENGHSAYWDGTQWIQTNEAAPNSGIPMPQETRKDTLKDIKSTIIKTTDPNTGAPVDHPAKWNTTPVGSVYEPVSPTTPTSGPPTTPTTH